ncbi:PQQ-binding-like beta-propeller repeat protein [Actinoplanes sp. N902-109]|uniref:PQQ-binding-like beta-propeller repeat protein n=1 Tax=Actinoplanes sp. (strain N902-109) TaxID=649831 RepID=UPI0003295B36|nr:PQQ-binding-like beta-propeller repeat protein [Actinoplanes sp. N902-109]AGL20588.1 hypothetical protein L083_7078 [Actinoplanes sp. N902-109]
MGVIELGLVTGEQEPPALAERHRLGSPREIRRVLVAAVALVCLLAVTASAPPRSHGPAQLWSIPMAGGNESYTMTADHVYVFTNAPGGRRLSAYELRTGTMLWSTTVMADASWLGAIKSGVLLLPAGTQSVEFDTDDGGQGFREFTRETIAIDAATGRELWRLPGEYSVATDRQVLLAEWDDSGAVARTLRVAGLRDGVTAWTQTGHGVHTWVAADTGDASRLITATADGLVEVRGFADGRLVTSGQLPWQKPPGTGERSTDISIEDHLLVVRNMIHDNIGDRAVVAAYDTGTLRERWHVDSTGFGGSYGCGPVMCLNDSAGISGYDPATGARRWHRPGLGYAILISHDRLIVDEGQDGTRHSVVDARTGATLAGLGDGMVVWDYEDVGEQTYVLRRTADPPGLTAVGEVDGRTGKVILRGTVDQVQDYGCQSAGELLACSTVDGRLTITDITPVTAGG